MHNVKREHFPEVHERKVFPFNASPGHSPAHSRLSTPALSRTGERAQRVNRTRIVTSHGVEFLGVPGPAQLSGISRPSSTPAGSRTAERAQRDNRAILGEVGPAQLSGISRPSSTPAGSRTAERAQRDDRASNVASHGLEFLGESGLAQHTDITRPSSTSAGSRTAERAQRGYGISLQSEGEPGPGHHGGISRTSSTPALSGTAERAQRGNHSHSAASPDLDFFGDPVPAHPTGISKPSLKFQTRVSLSSVPSSKPATYYQFDMTGLDHTHRRHKYDPKLEWGHHSVTNDLNPWLAHSKVPKWNTTSGMYGNHYRHPQQTYVRVSKSRMPVFNITL
jgi:hypothetical protein